MTSGTLEARTWSRRRWWSVVALILAAQALLIFFLEARSPVGPRKPALASPSIRWLNEVSLRSLAVSDPTLFVLPHREGFSGEGWLNRTYTPTFLAPSWTEPPRLLKLSADTLGASFKQFIAANSSPPFQVVPKREPSLSIPERIFLPTPPPVTTAEIHGPLHERRLLTPLKLEPWPSADLLTNSIVQVLVNDRGYVLSTMLRQSSGFKPADDRALEMSKTARFEPLPKNNLALGTILFEWPTAPPVTNAPPAIQ